MTKVGNPNEAKIRNAIWYLKTGKSKKFVCEFLDIPYNIKKLDKLIEDFYSNIEKEAKRKKEARTKIFTDKEKLAIARAYLEGESQSSLAERYYISTNRVKKILIETGTPIRARGKNKPSTVDHIVQDLEIKFSKNDKVFIAKFNCFGIIDEIYDEEYLEKLENGRQHYVEILPHSTKSKYPEPVEGIHYELYWFFNDGTSMKLDALKNLRNNVIKVIEETGRELYRVWRDDDFKCFLYLNRDELIPVRT